MSEIIFLAVLALIVIGPKQLPEVARTLGRFLNELKRSTSSLTDELKTQTRFDEFNLRDSILKDPPKSNHPPTPNPPPAAHANATPAPVQPIIDPAVTTQPKPAGNEGQGNS